MLCQGTHHSRPLTPQAAFCPPPSLRRQAQSSSPQGCCVTSMYTWPSLSRTEGESDRYEGELRTVGGHVSPRKHAHLFPSQGWTMGTQPGLQRKSWSAEGPPPWEPTALWVSPHRSLTILGPAGSQWGWGLSPGALVGS